MNGTLIHALLTSITKVLVNHPELVLVTTTASERGFNYEIQVAESDLGMVIGKQGRTARSIRTIISAAAMKLKMTACVNIAPLPPE